MNLRNFTLTSIKNIQKAQQKGKFIIFVGAGVSQNSNLPSWNDLVNNLAKDLGIEKRIIPEKLEETLSNEQKEILKSCKIYYNTDECLKIPQYYFNEFGEKEYNNKLHEIFQERLEPNPIDYLVLELDPKHIITTNYDNLLETTANNISKTPYSKVASDRELALAPNNNLIIKMHGELDTIVLKERDYDTYSNNFKLIETFVKGLIATNTILFVGFSAEDANVRKLFQWIHDILGNTCQPAYLLNTDSYKNSSKSKEEKRVKFEYLKEMGIYSLYYDEITNDINDFVTDDVIQEYTNRYNLQPLPNGHGERLFKLLYFIQRKNITNQNSEYIENCYNRLKLLNCLNYIPNQVLSKIFECNLKVFLKGGLYGVKPYLAKSIHELRVKIAITIDTLKTNDYINLLYDNPLIEENIRKEISKIYNQYCIKREENNKDIENQIQDILKSLRNSYKITKDEKYKVAYIYSKLNSTCIEPKDNKEFKPIFLYDFEMINKNLREMTINYSDNSVNIFKKAYLYIKLGNYKKAYYEFEKVAYEANSHKNYVLYVLAGFNQYYTGRLINNKYYFSKEDKDIEFIKEQYLKINIEDLIERFIPTEIKDVIKYITSFEIFKDIYTDVNDNYDKISNTYAYIKKGGSSSNNYVNELYGVLNELFAYSCFNYFVCENYEEYRKIYRKAFDSIFLSFLTKIEFENNKDKILFYPNCVPNFDYYDFYLIIEYSKDKDLEKVLKDINSDLKLDNETSKNYLISAYRNIIKNFEGYGINNNFYSKIYVFLMLFNKIQLSQIEIKEIIDLFITIIEYINENEIEDSYSFRNTKNKILYCYLVDTYNKYYPKKDFIDLKQLENLLFLTIEESINLDAGRAKAFDYDNLIRHICNIIKSSNNSYKFKNQKKIISLIDKINADQYWKLFIITYIYPFLQNQENILIIARKLLENCSTGEFVDVLFQSIFSKIIKIDKELVQKVIAITYNELSFNYGRTNHIPYNVTLLQLLNLIDYFIKQKKLNNKKIIYKLINDLEDFKNNYFEQIQDSNFKNNYEDCLMIIKLNSEYEIIDYSKINIEILRYIKTTSLNKMKEYLLNNQAEKDLFIENALDQLKNIENKEKYRKLMDLIKKLI